MARQTHPDAEIAWPIAVVIGGIVAIGVYTKMTHQAAEDARLGLHNNTAAIERRASEPRALSAELEAEIAARPGVWI